MYDSHRLVRIIEHPSFTLGRRDDGVAHMYFKDGCEITIELQKDFVKAYNELKENVDYPVLYEPGEGCTVTKEARENAVIIEGLTPICASAVIAPNTVYQLVANFYLKFNKPKKPYRVFRSEEGALEWLRTFLAD
jgi:hypothetical protein